MGALLRVESPFAVVELSGDEGSKATLLTKPFWPIPRVSVQPESMGIQVARTFPLLFEEQDYQILAQSKIHGATIEVGHRDERTLSNLRRIPNVEPASVVGTIRFRQSIGLSTFTFTVGDRSMSLTVEVFPAKLDYLADYEDMLRDVQELDRVLPLRYFDETFRRMGTKVGATGDPLEWIAILRSQVGDLAKALRYADRHPLLSLEGHWQEVRSHRVRHVTEQLRRSVARGQGAGGWENAVPGVPVRSFLRVEVPRDSIDSVEHRWLRGSLESVRTALTRVIQTLRAEEERRRARYPKGMSTEFRSRSGGEQQLDEIQELTKEVASLERLSIIREASRGSMPSNFASLRLLRSPGYSEAYRHIMALRLGLENVDGGIDVSVARMGSLYEAWCFVEVIRQVEALTGARLIYGLEKFIGRDTLGKRLVKGKNTEARFALADGRSLTIRYNRAYEGLTGTQVPDIELAFSKDGWPDLVVVFDAKYRLDASDDHVKFYGLAAPPQEAIGALHRYRDAIVIDQGELNPRDVRPVVRGAALYPLSLGESTNFPESKLADALKRYGIGAIPFLPGNTNYVRLWLQSILRIPHTELAWNGPPTPGAVVAAGARNGMTSYRGEEEAQIGELSGSAGPGALLWDSPNVINSPISRIDVHRGTMDLLFVGDVSGDRWFI